VGYITEIPTFAERTTKPINSIFDNGSEFIWRNARALERSIFEYRFSDGSPERILSIVRSYQNEDGGFGHALEPDVRAPDSQPLFAEFGLKTLYECGLRDEKLASRVCDFLERHSDLEKGIPALLPSSRKYPRAEHWENPTAYLPSLDRLIGLVGLANWQGVQHPWLSSAAEACVKRMTTTRFSDAHTIQTAFCLLETLPTEGMGDLFDKLAGDLSAADFYTADAPVSGYGLTPLTFSPSPDSFCRKLFTDSQLDGHLGELEAAQEAEGGWPIAWKPPGEMAKWEWRSCATLNALTTLRAYGRI